MALDGFIFDLDGVLVDSNSAHVEAWSSAMRRHDYHVEPDRIFVEMGKGGDKLVANILGDTAEKRRGEALRAAESEAFAALALKTGLPVAPGARELIDALKRRGLRMALATSSGAEQVALVEKASGVPWRALMDEVVSASDVQETKPAPDLVTAAVAKLGFAPIQCAMIGDTPWDAQSATQAGVVLLGVTRGGNGERVLRQSGARAVYRDPADLVDRLDEALRIASPGAAHLDAAALDALMEVALRAAEVGLDEGEVPVGCVVTDGSGVQLSTGHHTIRQNRDRTAHAQINALRRAAGRIGPNAVGTIMVSTVEPCAMCTGAAIEMGVDAIVHALPAPEDSGTRRVTPSGSRGKQSPRVIGGVKAEESRALFSRWLARPSRSRELIAAAEL